MQPLSIGVKSDTSTKTQEAKPITNSNAVDNKSTTDGFDGAGVGEAAGLENYIELNEGNLKGPLAEFFEKVSSFFGPNTLTPETTDVINETTDVTEDLTNKINENLEKDISIVKNVDELDTIEKLKAEIDENVSNGTLEEKQNYVLSQIKILDNKITSPGSISSKNESISLRSSYIEIFNEYANELGTEPYGGNVKLSTISPDLKVGDESKASSDVTEDLTNKINENLEKDISYVTGDTSEKSLEDLLQKYGNLTDQELTSGLHTIESQLGGINSGLKNAKDSISKLIERRNNGENIPDSALAGVSSAIESLELQANQLLQNKSDIEAVIAYKTEQANTNTNTTSVDVPTFIEITDEERAELDKVMEESEALTLQYANMTDQEIASITNAINSQMAGLESEGEEIFNKFKNGEISINERNAQIDALEDRERALDQQLSNLEAAKIYKNEAKVIDTMTDSQKAELETVNNKMLPLQEQLYVAIKRKSEVFDKAIKLNDDYGSGKITPEEYEAEFDKIEAQDNELQSIIENIYKELEPLETQRTAIFDNAGETETTDSSKYTTTPSSVSMGDTTSTDNLTEAEKRALEKMKEIGETLTNVGSGVTTSSGTTTIKSGSTGATTTDKTDDDKTTTSSTTNVTATPVKSSTKSEKTKTNIFTRAADKVESDDVEGVIDALKAKGITNTYTNAKKVADAADVDITRSKYNKAIAGSGTTEEVIDPDMADFKAKKKLDDDKRQGFSMKF